MCQYWQPQIVPTVKIEPAQHQTGYTGVDHSCDPLIEMRQAKQAAYGEETDGPGKSCLITQIGHAVHHLSQEPRRQFSAQVVQSSNFSLSSILLSPVDAN